MSPDNISECVDSITWSRVGVCTKMSAQVLDRRRFLTAAIATTCLPLATTACLPLEAAVGG